MLVVTWCHRVLAEGESLRPEEVGGAQVWGMWKCGQHARRDMVPLACWQGWGWLVGGGHAPALLLKVMCLHTSLHHIARTFTIMQCPLHGVVPLRAGSGAQLPTKGGKTTSLPPATYKSFNTTTRPPCPLETSYPHFGHLHSLAFWTASELRTPCQPTYHQDTTSTLATCTVELAGSHLRGILLASVV